MGAPTVQNLPAVREMWAQSLGQGDCPGGGKAAHSSIPAWRIPCTEEPGGLQSMGSTRWTGLNGTLALSLVSLLTRGTRATAAHPATVVWVTASSGRLQKNPTFRWPWGRHPMFRWLRNPLSMMPTAPGIRSAGRHSGRNPAETVWIELTVALWARKHLEAGSVLLGGLPPSCFFSC